MHNLKIFNEHCINYKCALVINMKRYFENHCEFDVIVKTICNFNNKNSTFHIFDNRSKTDWPNNRNILWYS